MCEDHAQTARDSDSQVRFGTTSQPSLLGSFVVAGDTDVQHASPRTSPQQNATVCSRAEARTSPVCSALWGFHLRKVTAAPRTTSHDDPKAEALDSLCLHHMSFLLRALRGTQQRRPTVPHAFLRPRTLHPLGAGLESMGNPRLKQPFQAILCHVSQHLSTASRTAAPSPAISRHRCR